MQLNHPDSTTPTLPPPKNCGNCGGEAQSILHHVRHRGSFRRLCTSCVLRLHPHSFCPTCFSVYQSPQPNGAITCVKCYSSTHSSCVVGGLQSRYVCPLCANPNAPLFVLKKANEVNLSGAGVYDGNGKGRVLDKRGAKVLVAAAMISSLSMSEAEVAARAVAERRAKEAASTRKRATQALDYMAALAAREKMKNEALAGLGRGSSMSRHAGNVGSGVVERRDGYGYNNRVGNGGSDVFGGVRIEEKKPIVGVMVDGRSNGVVTQLSNAVDFKENGGLGGVRPQGSGILERSSSNGVATDVDELRGISLGSGLEFQGEDALRESMNITGVLHPPKVDYMEGVEGSNPIQDDEASLNNNVGVENIIFGMQGIESGIESADPGKNENGVTMDVLEQRGILPGSGSEVRDSTVQDCNGEVLNALSVNSANIQDEDALRISVNSVVSNSPKEDWMEGVESSNPGMQPVENGQQQ